MGLAIFGPNTTDHASWTPSPSGRGTWDILFSCIVTLSLCVYSAIHLNIPPVGSTVWWKARKKAKWLLIALLAPEFVAFNAWRQRSEAHHIAKGLRERAGQVEPRSLFRRLVDMLLRRKVPETSDKHTYSLIHGFYVVMGGIVVDMSNDPDRVWPKGFDMLTLHSATFLKAYDLVGDRVKLLESADAIRDKSKADGLAKIIVCVQAVWFCVHFFARLKQGLTITLIELNTFAHAICALLIYLLWWEKPLDIDRPTIIETRHQKDLLDLCAFFEPVKNIYEADRWYRHLRFFFHNCCSIQVPEILSHFYVPFARWFDYASGAAVYKGSLKILKSSPTSSFPARSPPIPAFRGLAGIQDENGCQRTFLFTSYDPPILHLKSEELVPGGSKLRVRPEAQYAEMDECQLSQLQRIDKLMSRKQITKLGSYARHSFSVREFNFQLHRHVSGRWKRLSFRQEAYVGITLAGFFYGGLHALAWDSSSMHSPVEGTLWKISCLSVLCTGPYAALFSFVNSDHGFEEYAQKHEKLKLYLLIAEMLYNYGAMFYFILGVSIGFLYILCRLYLVVEVFLNIAYLPTPAFETPNWSPCFPHIS